MGVTVTEKELKDTERELMDLIAKRKQLENNLSNIETNIHLLEGTYLEETIHGNVVRGYEGYGSQRTMRKQRPHDGDRIFSQSSLSYLKAVEIRPDEYDTDDAWTEKYRPPTKRRKFEDD